MTNKKQYKLVLILGLDCGKRIYKLLSNYKNIQIYKVFSLHPSKAKNIAGYINFAKIVPSKSLSQYKNIESIYNSIKNINDLDMILAIGISDIIKPNLLNLPRLGVLGAHAAKLPDRPGCSPLIWAILDDIKQTEMTIFKMTEKIDDGLIYASKKVKINSNTYSVELRQKMDEALEQLIKENISNILGNKNRGKLKKGKRHYTRKRNLRDGQIDLNSSAHSILLKIRALSNPYPGAHLYSSKGEPIIIEKARLGDKVLKYKGSGKNSLDKILCIVAHPDDEALGVGGTLIKHVQYGEEVNIIILSEGEAEKGKSSKKNKKRLENANSWCKFTGCKLYKVYNFPDQKLDNVPLLKIIKALEKDINKIKPDIIYIHHPGDMNSDHQIAAQASLAALRPLNKIQHYPEIRAFETPSSTEQAPYIEPFIFKPNFFVAINDQWKKKVESLKCYSKELRKAPHPRSVENIKALAKKRGTESGQRLSEAFFIVKKIWE